MASREVRVRLDVTVDQLDVLRDAVVTLIEEHWPHRQRDKYAEAYGVVSTVAHLLAEASRRLPQKLYDGDYGDEIDEAQRTADRNPKWAHFRWNPKEEN